MILKIILYPRFVCFSFGHFVFTVSPLCCLFLQISGSPVIPIYIYEGSYDAVSLQVQRSVSVMLCYLFILKSVSINGGLVTSKLSPNPTNPHSPRHQAELMRAITCLPIPIPHHNRAIQPESKQRRPGTLCINNGENRKEGREGTSVQKISLQGVISVGPSFTFLSDYTISPRLCMRNSSFSQGIILCFRLQHIFGMKSSPVQFISLHNPIIFLSSRNFLSNGLDCCPTYIMFFSTYDDSIPFYMF